MNDKNNNLKSEEVWNSLDGISRATPGPYFFTRLQQRLNAEENSIWTTIGLWISKPAIAFSVLLVVILLNLAVIFNQNSVEENLEDSPDFYSIATANILDEENPF